MAAPEDTNQVSRAKRATGIASAAGRRERRAPASKDLDVELAKPARRNVAPPAQPDDSSDRSEETGIASLEAGATDAVPALAPAAQSAAKRAKSKAAPAVKASAGGCDVDSAKALKVAKPAASAKKTAQAAPAKAEEVAPRQRPTNNQLLYKARFNWGHYTHALTPGTRERLPSETHACASVTSAFLQVLKAIHTAEIHREHGGRNVLKLLSVNTRRTKVVALSTGTHRVPDELRRHQLADEEGNEYSTNLDRNRYGNDDQYLFTVIKFNLEALGLCPLICQVEIIDAKAKAEDCLVVKVPEEHCTCRGERPEGLAVGPHGGRIIVGGSATHPHHAAAAAAAAAAGAGKPRTAPDSATKSEKPQWRVPATPMSPLKRNASAGDAGGMGMLLDALAQVGGMPPPSPLHLRSPPHGALRRQSYLSTGAMAAASPSMRPAAAAMSALCASAPPSADRADATTGGVGGVAAAAAAAAAHYYAQGLASETPGAHAKHFLQQFHSPPANGAVAAAGFSIPAATDFHGRAALEEMLERATGERAAALAAEAKATARVARLEEELAAAKAPTGADDVAVAAAVAAADARAERAEERANAVAAAVAARMVAMEEELAAFGARVAAATTAATRGDAEAMAALYVAEASAHARALTRVARLEATSAEKGFAEKEVKANEANEAETARAEAGVAEEAAAAKAAKASASASEPASPSAVADVAEQAAAAGRRARREEDAMAFEPPPAKRPALPFVAATSSAAAANATAATAAAMAAAAAAGYAPPTTPSLAAAPIGRDGILSPPDAAQSTRLSFAGAGRA